MSEVYLVQACFDDWEDSSTLWLGLFTTLELAENVKSGYENKMFELMKTKPDLPEDSETWTDEQDEQYFEWVAKHQQASELRYVEIITLELDKIIEHE